MIRGWKFQFKNVYQYYDGFWLEEYDIVQRANKNNTYNFLTCPVLFSTEDFPQFPGVESSKIDILEGFSILSVNANSLIGLNWVSVY